MSNSTPATIEDVARIAEVSIATVSRAIHNPEKVANSTRLKVNQAIAMLPPLALRQIVLEKDVDADTLLPIDNVDAIGARLEHANGAANFMAAAGASIVSRATGRVVLITVIDIP